MKKQIILITALAAGSAGVASAQTELVAAWDFSQYDNVVGFPTVDGTTIESSLDSNYSEFGTLAQDQPGADFGSAFGTFYFDGTNGSSDVDGTSPQEAFVSGPFDTAVSNLGFLGTGGSFTELDLQGQTHQNSFALGFNDAINGGSFSFAVDLTGYDSFSSGSDWLFTFSAQNELTGDTSTIDWDYSTDGTTFASTGVTTSVDDAAGQKTVDLSGVSALNGETQVWFQGNVTGIDSGGKVYVDNLAVNAVPEPSAFAAIAGMLAIGFAACRRRRS